MKRIKDKITLCILKESLCIGGTERSAANISKILEKDYELYMCLFNGQDIQYSFGGELVDIKAPPLNSKLMKVLNSFIRVFKVKKHLKTKKIDILYEFLSITNFLSFIKHRNITKIISCRDYGKMNRLSKYFKMALNRSNAMICNSKYIKDYYLSKYPEDKDKVFTVYNVIDTEEICRQSKEETEKEFLDFISLYKHNIVSVGRFCKEKGFEYLIEAFAKVLEDNQDCGLVLVGDGEYKEKYDEVIEKYNLKDHIYFTGFQSNPYKYMARCDMFVLSSLSEGFPNVLAEAMALSLPVIAANCYSGPAEILQKDYDYEAVNDKFCECDYGIITPGLKDNDNDNSILEISKAIKHLITDKDLQLKFSKLASERAEVFSPETARNKLNEIFKMLTKKE